MMRITILLFYVAIANNSKRDLSILFTDVKEINSMHKIRATLLTMGSTVYSLRKSQFIRILDMISNESF